MALDVATITMVAAADCGMVTKNVLGQIGCQDLWGGQKEALGAGVQWQRWRLAVMCEISRAAIVCGGALPGV